MIKGRMQIKIEQTLDFAGAIITSKKRMKRDG